MKLFFFKSIKCHTFSESQARPDLNDDDDDDDDDDDNDDDDNDDDDNDDNDDDDDGDDDDDDDDANNNHGFSAKPYNEKFPMTWWEYAANYHDGILSPANSHHIYHFHFLSDNPKTLSNLKAVARGHQKC